MKQLNLYYLGGGGGGSVPDGRTVTPIADAQLWIKCAGRDENYTTLSEILADSVCLNYLMASDNAVDYLVRSTLWVSDVTSNSSAMTYIGTYDYCAETLLADSTWLSGILASSYVTSVLTTVVPKMTSNTAPEGVAAANSIASTSLDAWKAFNSSESYGWLPASSGTSNVYVNYTFEYDVVVYYAIVTRLAGGSAATSTCKFRSFNSSDSKVNQTSNFNMSTGSTNVKKVFSVPDVYRSYELLVVSDSKPDGGTGYKIQFYGRRKAS